MTRPSIVLAAGWLLVAAAVCQADDGVYESSSVVTTNASDSRVAPVATPATGPVVVEAGSCCGNGSSCCGSGSDRSCLQHFWAWLTYEPLVRTGACGCFHGCSGCEPPIYTYFPCAGCNNGCGSSPEPSRPCFTARVFGHCHLLDRLHHDN